MQITTLSTLKNLPKGTDIYLENHIIPNRSRHTKVHSNYSYFFTVNSKGNDESKESWIFDSKNYPTVKQMIFGEGKVSIMDKAGKPFLTIYYSPEYISTFPKES